MIYKLVIISAFVVLATGQAITFGPCPNATVVQDFDVDRYLGQWYQLARFANSFEQGNCSSALYGPVEDGLVKVHNVEIRDGVESSIDGTAEFADFNSTEAKLIVKFSDPDTEGDYWVLGTDYDNYSVVWSCLNHQEVNVQFAWVLARQKPTSQENIEKIKQIFIDNGVNPNTLEIDDQPECETQP